MYNYCTLFDSNYLTRGLMMYESLKKYSDNFHLYIFAFNDKSHKLLISLNLDFTTVISLKEFENNKLLSIKNSRSAGEYCWTCTPSVIKYSIETYNLDSCTYLDADLYFFSNPAVLIDEMGYNSVLITPHRYTKKYDQSKTSGIYCVQFMTFKNTQSGMKVLNWWVDACIDWCYARAEDGKFGDQKYLDDWTNMFNEVYVSNNLGGGVAPWNIQQYNFTYEKDKIIGIEKLHNNKFDLIFYHFHALKFLGKDIVNLGSYDIDKNDIKMIYKDYIIKLRDLNIKFNLIENSKNTINKNLLYKIKRIAKDPMLLLRYFGKKISVNDNIFNIKDL